MIIRNAKALGLFIRNARTKAHLTQAALADLALVSRKWVSDVESGKPSADFSLILRTLIVLGIDMDLRQQIRQPGQLDELDAVIARTRLKDR